VPGKIELDYPYDPSGKLKPHYSCDKVSSNQCYESCVNRKRKELTPKPPDFWLSHNQCDQFANDIERQCSLECKNK
jgi:hypothetical protein